VSTSVVVQKTTLARDFLWWGFLKQSSFVVLGLPVDLAFLASPLEIDKGGAIKYQVVCIGSFPTVAGWVGLSLELVVREQRDDFLDGDDRDFPYPLGIFTPLDWALVCIKDVGPVKGVSSEGNVEKPSTHVGHRRGSFSGGTRGLHSKSRGRRELLNLECSINYDTLGASSRRGEGKAHIL
jgi:hypothetical protein